MVVGLIALSVGGLLILGAAIWALKRRDGSEPGPDPWPGEPELELEPEPEPDDAPDVPTLSVVALGLIGAGKSVLLGSQARELRPAAGRRYHLDCDLDQNRVLAQLHSQVRDTRAPWPLATRPGDAREFLFDCKATDGVHQRTVFRIDYFDYPGELLAPGVLTGSASELETRVARAHALLVIVDGQQILALLDGDEAVHDEFEDQVWPMIALAHRAQCPVQLIITKWDLVRLFDPPVDDDELLRKVWTQLERHPVIKQLVRAHCQRDEEVRLIPVSAVGSRFADLRADGTVAKRSDGVLEPMNVDVPLCAVIPDLLRRVEQSLDPSVRRQLHDEVDRVPLGEVSEMAQSVLASRVGVLVRSALAVLVGDFVVTWFVETLVGVKSRRALLPSSGDGEGETLRLRLDVIEDMEQVVDDFEDRLRGSVLCSRRRSR